MDKLFNMPRLRGSDVGRLSAASFSALRSFFADSSTLPQSATFPFTGCEGPVGEFGCFTGDSLVTF